MVKGNGLKVTRFNDTTLVVNKRMVVSDENDHWHCKFGGVIESPEMNAIYTYLYNEMQHHKKQFNNYVDGVIQELIYN